MILTAHDKQSIGLEPEAVQLKRRVRHPGSYSEAMRVGVNPRRVWARLDAGWNWEDALRIPARQKTLSAEDTKWRMALVQSVLDAHGMRNKQLARIMGVPPSLISKWKHGRQALPARRVTVLSNLLEIAP